MTRGDISARPDESVAITPGLFRLDAGGGGTLLGGYCLACTRYHFPRFGVCPYCSAQGTAERPLSERGVLRLFTAVVNRPPGYRGEVPFGFGVIELPEKLRIISRITETRLERLRVGQPMRLVFSPLHVDDEGREVVSYAFAPEEEEG